MGICRIDGKIRGAVEELESCIKKYGEVPTLKTLKPLLSLAEEYLKIEGWPEERGYLEKLENDNPYLTEDWNAGFNEALRLCKLAAMREIGMLKEEAANDYADMRRFQERFIAADQELRAMKKKYGKEA